MKLSELIQQSIDAKGYTVGKVARLSGLERTTVWRMLKPEAKNERVSFVSVAKIAKALQIDPALLLECVE